MSYKWKKEKRLRAHEILGKLWDVAVPYVDGGEIDFPYTDLVQIYQTKGHVFSAFYSTLTMLYENSHIVTHPQKADKGFARITPKGFQAFKESFYIVENRKDYLETIEYITKWIIPIISIVLSVTAFCFSIYTFLHPHN